MRSRTWAYALRATRPAGYVAPWPYGFTPHLAKALLFRSKREARNFSSNGMVLRPVAVVAVRLA